MQFQSCTMIIPYKNASENILRLNDILIFEFFKYNVLELPLEPSVVSPAILTFGKLLNALAKTEAALKLASFTKI